MEKSLVEKIISMVYSVKYYLWFCLKFLVVNDLGNFRFEWIFIGIYVVFLMDL